MVHDNLKSNPFNDLELSEKTSYLRDGYILSRMVYKTHGLSMNKIKIKVPPPFPRRKLHCMSLRDTRKPR